MASAQKLATVPTLTDLLSDPERVSALPREAIAELRGQLARLDTILLGRLIDSAQAQPDAANGDSLLDVTAAAARLGTSEDWIYSHADALPFTVRVGKKHLRFSEAGIGRYIRQRSGR
jgi:predicted DNA-binding transcriptional regulator AlpA